MNDREFEQKITELMGQDLSAGTDAFRDNLLERCLAELEDKPDAVELDDEDLEMLSAAGDMRISVSGERRRLWLL